jgi:hypothetical protein
MRASAPMNSSDTRNPLAPVSTPARAKLFRRSLPVVPGTDPADAIRSYLAARRTGSAKALAAKAVLLIDPQNRAGEIVWPANSDAS